MNSRPSGRSLQANVRSRWPSAAASAVAPLTRQGQRDGSVNLSHVDTHWRQHIPQPKPLMMPHMVESVMSPAMNTPPMVNSDMPHGRILPYHQRANLFGSADANLDAALAKWCSQEEQRFQSGPWDGSSSERTISNTTQGSLPSLVSFSSSSTAASRYHGRGDTSAPLRTSNGGATAVVGSSLGREASIWCDPQQAQELLPSWLAQGSDEEASVSSTSSRAYRSAPSSPKGKHVLPSFDVCREGLDQYPKANNTANEPSQVLATKKGQSTINGGKKADKKTQLFKTEMCRSYEETGICKYGTRCHFAHNKNELREVQRHAKYKTEVCKTFWEKGSCPYGKRCCFIHTEKEATVAPTQSTKVARQESRLAKLGKIRIDTGDETLEAATTRSPPSPLNHLASMFSLWTMDSASGSDQDGSSKSSPI